MHKTYTHPSIYLPLYSSVYLFIFIYFSSFVHRCSCVADKEMCALHIYKINISIIHIFIPKPGALATELSSGNIYITVYIAILYCLYQ